MAGVGGGSIGLALGSAVSYGAGDFIGGAGGRRTSATQMSLLVQATGVVFAVAAVGVAGRSAPGIGVLGWGAVSGVGSALGSQSLYRGLAAGAMNVAAPLSAILTAALPAVVGLLGGDRLSIVGWSGLVVALPAVGLVSLGRQHTAHSQVRAGAGWGLLAGVGFGLLFIALDRAGTGAGTWPLLPGQLVAVALAGLITLIERRRASDRDELPRWRPALWWGIGSGVGGASGNLLFFLAAGAGELTVVAVLTSLYPALTVLLAAIVLRERATASQGCGLAAAAIAVVLITIG